MNWSALAAIAAIASLCVTIAGVVFVAGKLSQKLSDHDDRLDEQHKRLDSHEARITTNDVSIEGLKEWRAGFNAATWRGDKDGNV